MNGGYANEPRGRPVHRNPQSAPDLCRSETHPCKFSGTSGVGHVEGITVQRLAVIVKSGTVGATIFIPDGNEPLPDRLLTLGNPRPQQRYRLATLRMGTGSGGSASIVLDGAIDWRSPSDEFIRLPEFQFCAGQWLFQHVNIDLTRTADAGNLKVGWIDNDVSHCGIELSGRARCWPGGFQLGFGQLGEGNRGTRMRC